MQCIEGCLLYIPKYAREVASGKFSAWIWKMEENKWITTGIKPEKYKLGMYASVVDKKLRSSL